MPWTFALILMVLWVLALISGTVLGGVIHILFILAIFTVIFNIASGRRLVG